MAFDTGRASVFVALCCEPASGHLWRVDSRAPRPAFEPDDQGFAVDAAGHAPLVVRADTFGTLAWRSFPSADPEIRADAGAADVAADAGQVVALVDSERLRAFVPGIAKRGPGLWLRRQAGGGGWDETHHSLPTDESYCRVVPLPQGAIGLLAGRPDHGRPWLCFGDRLDVYEPALQRLRMGVLRFPDQVRHLSVDDSSTFLVYTTVRGAVGWRTLDGRGGALARRGFAAADW